MKVNKMTLSDVIPVDFSWLSKVKLGVKTHLESKILKWDNRIQGIIKNFCKIRLLGKKAKIIEDCGLILVNSRYTLNYYSPQIGDRIEATVKNWTENSIGGLSECFNTTISTSDCKYENDIWKDVNGVEIKRDSKVTYTLEK